MNDGLDTRNTVTGSAASMNILTTDWQAEAERLRETIRGLEGINQAAIALAMDRALSLERGGIFEPIDTTVKDANWLLAVISKMVLDGNNRLTLLDTKYKVPSRQSFEDVIRKDWVHFRQYETDFLDCDNFAFQFKANADWRFGCTTVGLVVDRPGGHAYNFVVFDDATWEIFEPQNDWYTKVGSAPLYTLTNSELMV